MEQDRSLDDSDLVRLALGEELSAAVHNMLDAEKTAQLARARLVKAVVKLAKLLVARANAKRAPEEV